MICLLTIIIILNNTEYYEYKRRWLTMGEGCTCRGRNSVGVKYYGVQASCCRAKSDFAMVEVAYG